MKKIVSLVVLFVAFATTSMAQSIVGTWKTIDDETGKAKSHITITEKNGIYEGKVSKILDPKRQNSKCTKCKGVQKDQPILGLQIIFNLKKIDATKYANGKIMDPQKGKEYALVILPNGSDKITVKGGYKVLGKMVGRTQTWHRVNM